MAPPAGAGLPLSRRSVLRGSAAALVCTPLAAPASAPCDDGLHVVHQPSRAASSRFAQAWRQPRLDATDLAALLYRDLPALWQHPQALLTGLTDPTLAFCLERVAFEQGWRTVWRAAAETPDAGTLAAAVAQHLAAPHRWQAQALHGAAAPAAPLQAWAMAPRSRLVPPLT